MKSTGTKRRTPIHRQVHPLEILLGVKRKTNQQAYRKNPNGQLYIPPKQGRKK